jgi:hypothetical protein
MEHLISYSKFLRTTRTSSIDTKTSSLNEDMISKQKDLENKNNENKPNGESICRNPTLAKCGGEAQHLEKVGIGVLWDSRKLRRQFGRPKHLALGCS